jgi:hypothetical protein
MVDPMSLGTSLLYYRSMNNSVIFFPRELGSMKYGAPRNYKITLSLILSLSVFFIINK